MSYLTATVRKHRIKRPAKVELEGYFNNMAQSEIAEADTVPGSPSPLKAKKIFDDQATPKELQGSGKPSFAQPDAKVSWICSICSLVDGNDKSKAKIT